MAETSADFTNSFRALCNAADGREEGFRTELGESPAGDDWLRRWRERVVREATEPAQRAAAMRREIPAVIPRNHRVETALSAAVEGDLDPLESLLQALAYPWEERLESLVYRQPPEPHEVVQQTFCGT